MDNSRREDRISIVGWELPAKKGGGKGEKMGLAAVVLDQAPMGTYRESSNAHLIDLLSRGKVREEVDELIGMVSNGLVVCVGGENMPRARPNNERSMQYDLCHMVPLPIS